MVDSNIKEKEDFGLSLEDMVKAGMHFGHKPSKLHPKMRPYVYGVKKTTHIIDLEKTVEEFNKALRYIQKLLQQGKTLLLVGTKIQCKELVKETALECNLPYVNERWLGGFFTNFDVMRKRIKHFKDFREKIQSRDFESYTKKEQLKMEKDLRNLETKFAGVENLENLPDAIFICDLSKNDLALKEAKRKSIPVISITDTDVDPSTVDYPIPANDDAVSSVKYILEKVREVILGTEVVGSREIKEENKEHKENKEGL